MEVYSIRHIPTGRFMPYRMHRSYTRGWSYWGPLQPHEYDGMPRIFFTRRAAINALSMWLHGVWKNDTTCSGEYGEDISVETVPFAPAQPRHRNEMEIVVMELIDTDG